MLPFCLASKKSLNSAGAFGAYWSRAFCLPSRNPFGKPLILASRSESEMADRSVALGSCASAWTSSMIDVEVCAEVGGGCGARLISSETTV